MRKRPTSEEVDTFMQAYGRKAPRGQKEPNDRRYSRPLEELIKRMDPRDLDALMRGEDESFPTADSDDEGDASS